LRVFIARKTNKKSDIILCFKYCETQHYQLPVYGVTMANICQVNDKSVYFNFLSLNTKPKPLTANSALYGKNRNPLFHKLALITFAVITANQAIAADFTVSNGSTATSTKTLDSDGDTGTVEAGGKIEISSSSDAISITAANTVINNLGVISTTRTSSDGINSFGVSTTINNSGTITTATGASNGISITEGSVEINNSGTISASTLGVGIIIDTVVVNATVINTSTGSITGRTALRLNGNNSKLINSGTISTTNVNAIGGDVKDQTITLEASSNVTGNIFLLGGTDTVNIVDEAAASTNGNIEAGEFINFISNNTSATDYDYIISDAAKVTKTGTGILILSGNNTYTGGTLISAGTLQGTTSSLQGAIENNATLNFAQVSDGIFSNVISGTGQLIKSGAGNLTLTGNNTYTGTTTVSNGTLTVTSDTIKSDIINNSVVTFDQSSNGTYSDDISGSGSVIKANSGTLILTGDNSYSGGTSVNAGTLQGSTESLQGNISNNASIAFDQTSDGTFSGVISGTGDVTKLGAGVITFTGNNTYTGSLIVAAGSIQGTTDTLARDITNNANVIFNQTTNGDYADIISGTGSVTKQGTGSVNFTGINTYTGDTQINAGTLYINGSNTASTVNINTSGILGGSGNVGAVNVSGGTISPGNSIGTLTVNGNLDFSGAGIYEVEVDAAGQSDLIVVTSQADLSSGVVNVVAQAGDYSSSTDYTILSAAGGLNGTEFSSVSSNFAFLTPTLSYGVNDVFLNLARNNTSFVSTTKTYNQAAVANLLTDLSINNKEASQSLIDKITPLSTLSAQQAFDSLSAIQHTHSQIVTNRLTDQFTNNTLGNTKYRFAFNDSDASPARGLWIQSFAGFGDIDNSDNVKGSDYSTKGFAIGTDTQLANTTLGFAVNYAKTDLSPFAGNIDIDSYQVIAYSQHQNNAFYINTSLGLGYHDITASRTISIGNDHSSADADYKNHTANITIEIGKDFQFENTWQVSPYIGLDYNYNKRDDFNETGTSIGKLVVDSNTSHSLTSEIGIHLNRSFESAKGHEITPYLDIAYKHEYLDDSFDLQAAFSSAPNSSFNVKGTRLSRDRLHINTGVRGYINKTTSLNVGYSGELSDSDKYHQLTASISIDW